MVSDWKHKSQLYKRKAYGRKEGGQIREQRHAGGMRRYIQHFLHIIVYLIIVIDEEGYFREREEYIRPLLGYNHFPLSLI